MFLVHHFIIPWSAAGYKFTQGLPSDYRLQWGEGEGDHMMPAMYLPTHTYVMVTANVSIGLDLETNKVL